ncbi:hypothetical protein IWQ60_000841 [Tieghemiomyces parasiticus]|uniref:Uncharacterized protein n=1 Tax=Tieghemiomyces parasiticus TaxID=78921 RepID=A0A9W8AE26_9FUNG|nr:hypothetical protein IWQ60_000841 [Tieghemiomyces parasiticus]
MSTINAAGLVIFRYERNQPEYLLINDAFNHKRHWCPPKGRVIGQEDELKCAVRSSLDVVGLAIQDLQVDDQFAANLKYLSGTQAKHVAYYLARLVDPHRVLRIGAGLNHCWLPLAPALDKAAYPNMQDVLNQAHAYLLQHRDRFTTPSPRTRPDPANGRSEEPRRVYRPPHQRQSTDEGSPRGPGTESPSEPDAEINRGYRRYSRGEDSSTGSGMYRPPRQHRANFDPTHEEDGDGHPLHSQMRNLRLNPAATGPDAARLGSNGRGPSLSESPIYKTRLCRTFEIEGACPYGPKCTFAHGPEDLRERPRPPPVAPQAGGPYPPTSGAGPHQGPGRPSPYGLTDPAMSRTNSQGWTHPAFARPAPTENPLFKTRLCDKFMRDNYCPYGDRCTFAHGYEQLQNRPNAPLAFSGHEHQGPPYHGGGGGSAGGYGMSSNMRSREPILLEPRTPLATPTSFLEHANRLATVATATPVSASVQRSVDTEPASAAPARPATPPASTPALVEPAPQEKGRGKKKHQNHEEVQRRPRIVEVDAKEFAKFEQPPPKLREATAAANSTSASPRVAQDEALAAELRQLLPSPLLPASGTAPPKALTALSKEVTRFEFRHDVSKQQMFHILIPALFEQGGTSTAAPTPERIQSLLAHYRPLFAGYLKSPADQRLLLNAWDRHITAHSKAWLSRAAVVFKLNYDLDLVDEEVFLAWNAEALADSELKKKVAPFVEWLATAEEEDEDE